MLPASTRSVIFYLTIPTFRQNLLITPEGETTDMNMGQKILTNALQSFSNTVIDGQHQRGTLTKQHYFIASFLV